MTKQTGAPRQALGEVVDYRLSAMDARMINEQAPKKRVNGGETFPLAVTKDRGGDCVDGIVEHEGFKLGVSCTNRGYSPGQWDWPRRAA